MEDILLKLSKLGNLVSYETPENICREKIFLLPERPKLL